MRTQTMVQLTDELLRRLDERAAHEGVSRSQVIRDAVAAHLAEDAHEQAVRRFQQAYVEHPDTPDEMATAEGNAPRAGGGGAVVRRGEVYWLEVDDLGRRPVLVLTAPELVDILRRVVVAGLSTTVRDLASEVRVGPDDGVVKESVVNLLDVGVVPRALLVERMTTLSEGRMQEVCRALGFVTGGCT